MFRFIVMGIGTITTAVYVILLLKGSKYDRYIQGLPKEGFSDKELFSAGYVLQSLPMFTMNSPTGERLIADARLLHPENEGRYAEYWARLYWARTLTMSFMVLAGTFCAAGIMDGILMQAVTLAAGLIGLYFMYDSGVNNMKNEIQKREDACVYEFSNMVSKMSLLMNCNMTLHDAWFKVAYSSQGPIYGLMQTACEEMRNGKGDVQAIYDFGVRTNSTDIRKFSGILIQSITKSGSDITIYLRRQAQELGGKKKQLLLRKGDEASAKLLLPTMMFMGGIILIIMAAAVGGMDMMF